MRDTFGSQTSGARAQEGPQDSSTALRPPRGDLGSFRPGPVGPADLPASTDDDSVDYSEMLDQISRMPLDRRAAALATIRDGLAASLREAEG